MPLTSDQIEQVNKFLRTKLMRDICPTCHVIGHWVTGDIIAGVPFSSGEIKVGDIAMPMLQVYCENCGRILLFNARIIGLP